MALEDLNPAVRVEEILDGADIEPATRLEYFMKKAANEVPKPAGSSDAGKVVTVNEDGDGFELSDVDPGLPEIAGVSDAGKVVTVNAAGSAYELATPGGGGEEWDNTLTLTNNDGSLVPDDTFAHQASLGDGISLLVFHEEGFPDSKEVCTREIIVNMQDQPVKVEYRTKALDFIVDSSTQIKAWYTSVDYESDSSITDGSEFVYVNLSL